jgi:hypothetical protein
MEKDPLFEAISEEIRETKRLANAAWAGVEELRKQTQILERKADAAWELVVLTRNQINRPWWKRMLGIN